jgi:hypothetical protein
VERVPPCPGCEAPPAITVRRRRRLLWWKRPFEEQLYSCAEGHIYSVRVSAEATTAELHESVETWLRDRTGEDAPTRPPGL